jgi:hypothetical protein
VLEALRRLERILERPRKPKDGIDCSRDENRDKRNDDGFPDLSD